MFCIYFRVPCRLAAEVAAASFTQTLGRVDADLAALDEYLRSRQEHANRQVSRLTRTEKRLPPCAEGNLDVKYLQARYEKGCKRVQQFMEDAQRYVALNNLQDALPDFISFFSNKDASESLPGLDCI